MPSGYYRYPTIHRDTIAFVTEDDLWSVPRTGGRAHRLTTTSGTALYPFFSPDGSRIAFVSTDEGSTEVYVIQADSGRLHRLTYLGADTRVLGWSPEGTHIVFASNAGQAFTREFCLYSIAAASTNGETAQLPYGPARSIAFGPRGQVVLGRFTGEPANWMRYRGGTAGQLWIDVEGRGAFERFMQRLGGNITAPMWLHLEENSAGDTGGAAGDTGGAAGDTAGEDRIYFVSDHEGVGNLYSCRPDRSDLRRHTDSDDFYVRNPTTDGRRIVYHAGADLFVFDPHTEQVAKVEIDFHGPRVQRNRRFVDAPRFLDTAEIHPSGRALAVTTRGKAFAFYNFDGPVIQYGQRTGVRYRLPEWLNDGRRFVVVSDAAGEERLEIFSEELTEPPVVLDGLDLGRPTMLRVSPTEDKIAVVNHRNEVLIVDVRSEWGGRPPAERVRYVDRSLYGPIAGLDWSPDGRWIAYGCSLTPQTAGIRLYRLDAPSGSEAADASATDGATDGTAPNPITVSRPVLRDVAPAFDPEGKYLYFLSFREFNPVYDTLHLELGFPWGMRPYLITLQADLPNPFVFHPELEEEDPRRKDGGKGPKEGGDGGANGNGDENEGPTAGPPPGAPAPAEPPPPTPPTPNPAPDETPAPGPAEPATPGDEPAPPAPAGDDAPAEDDAPAGTEAAQHAAQHLSQHSTLLQPPPQAPESGPQTEQAAPGRTPAAPEEAGPPPIRIDLEGIQDRVLAFPVPDARYGQIRGIPGKALFTTFRLQGALDNEEWEETAPHGVLRAFSFRELRAEVLAEGISWFELSRNRKKVLYGSGRRLRVIGAGEKAPQEGGPPRRSGWIDLQRVKVSVDPLSEWRQMLREAWRLQRDHFWSEDMQLVDWHAILRRYEPLVERISSRLEFSDLLREMQGELGTSHTYELGGDFRLAPYYGVGFLGAELRWEPQARGYRIVRILRGDAWNRRATSPLARAGVDVQVGDLLVAINGQLLTESQSPAQLLVNLAGQEVLLTLRPGDAGATRAGLPRVPDGGASDGSGPDGVAAPPETAAQGSVPYSVVVRTLRSETPVHYRAWVEENRRRVHALSSGRVGYVHIPDMGPNGYAEFHRGYLAETDRDGLIVDVRYNAGGHVSQLILEKLARRRIGYESSRWGGVTPYPSDSVAGPMVALTNEFAGSDGDIFCHSFKLLRLGPLVGKRTWGGVIGINPRHPLVDGTVTTQPEYGFWFSDVGWGVENYGTEPDIDVDYLPQDYAAGRDPQLERAVVEALRLLAESPVLRPDFAARPSRARPTLPPRP